MKNFKIIAVVLIRVNTVFPTKEKTFFSCFRNNVEHIPVILAGDFNGCPKDAVYSHVMESGFLSSYQSVHNREPHVTHRVYNGEEILVDYIFFR